MDPEPKNKAFLEPSNEVVISINVDQQEIFMIDEETYSVILEKLGKASEAYQAKDAEGFMRLVSDRDDVVFVGSSENDVTVGKSDIKVVLEHDFEIFDSITITFGEVMMSRHAECVVVFAEVESEVVVGDDVSEIAARQTFVFELIDSDWKIAHSHFSFPQE